MATKNLFRPISAMVPCRSILPCNHGRPASSFSSTPPFHTCKSSIRTLGFRFARRVPHPNCSYGESPSSSYSSSSAAAADEDDSEQGPPQEAVLKAISEGRVGQTTNMVIGGTVTDDSTSEWLALDKKVNSYPTVRDFTAIGTGGDDFVQAMVIAVESVLQHSIPEDSVKQKISSRGKYVSVNIGPVHVISSEQVQAIYNAMKTDERMKYFL
ncbi:uncharacterized protein LOC124920684 isoform X2 [Impatiens glandulifera]|uniref:uncharacterized protein LOC124920684 isoform X2 n=1 Tax=Impatiens glandulifera TaxID=253017 RepID=UPI001FB0E455|nr:uncharacterized protein LOC124920684 isoform X2 [Impatiens glandulifera]